MSPPDQISALIQRQDHQAAWSALVSTLATQDGSEPAWLAYIAGRAADGQAGCSAFLLWDVSKQAIKLPHGCQQLAAELQSDETRMQAFARKLFESDENYWGASALISGAMAVCRAALVASQPPSESSRDDVPSSVRGLLHQAAQAYAQFWEGESVAQIQWPDGPLQSTRGAGLVHEIASEAERSLPHASA